MVEARLKYVAVHLTYVCENKCPHCYVGDQGREKHAPFKNTKKVIEKLAKDGVENILLVGGNPCTYPFLKKVVSLAKKSNQSVHILSNTLDFRKNFSYFLYNIDGFQATILGSTQKEHDDEAGRKGAYSILVKNIKTLNKRGKEITLAFSLYRQNYNNIFRTVENLIEKEKIKIKELVIQRIIPYGRAANTPKSSITKKQVPVIFEQIQKIKNKYNLKIDFEDPFPLCTIPKRYRHLQNKVCEWGFTKGSVNFNGDMSRCGADGRFSLGNVLKVNNLQEFWTKNPLLVDFRSRKWLPKKCQSCRLLEKCGGGCSLSKITDKDHDCDVICPLC